MNNFMNKLSTVLGEALIPIMNKMDNNRYFSSIRDALVSTMGLTIIGSFCLLIATFPFPKSYVEFMTSNPNIQEMLFIPFSLTTGIISVYIAFGIGYFLSEHYGLNKLIGGITSLFVFLVMVGGVSSEYLGAEGMFTAIIASILTVDIMNFCLKKNIAIRLPKQVPSNIAGGFTALIPSAITTLVVMILVYVIGFDVNGILTSVLTPLITAAGNSVVTALIYAILATLMWFAGLHPQIIATILSPAWTVMEAANMEAVIAGTQIQYIFVQPFYFTFVFIGGQCGTLMLNIIMLRSKSQTHRDLARLALPAGIFNINEPILFGLPIVLNPILIVPALIGQVVSVLVTWLAFVTGLVPGIGNPAAALWNLPSVIASALCTSSWRGTALVIFNMIIQGLIYLPFYRVVESEMVAQEIEEQ